MDSVLDKVYGKSISDLRIFIHTSSALIAMCLVGSVVSMLQLSEEPTYILWGTRTFDMTTEIVIIAFFSAAVSRKARLISRSGIPNWISLLFGQTSCALGGNNNAPGNEAENEEVDSFVGRIEETFP